jgi:hypothetical protein
MPELIRGTCANCEAEEVILKYARHTMCSKYACQAAAHLLVIARRSKAQSEERNPKAAAPTYCYKIHSIHGQRDVDPGQLTAKKRRNAVDDADYEDAYLVHGDFGEDSDDDGYKDTRWVLLSDILTLSATDLKVVVTYEKTLNKRQENKRRALEVAGDEE